MLVQPQPVIWQEVETFRELGLILGVEAVARTMASTAVVAVEVAVVGVAAAEFAAAAVAADTVAA